MKKFILLIASIVFILSVSLFIFKNEIVSTKFIKWEYEITNSLDNQRDKIQFVFKEKKDLIGNISRTILKPKFDKVKNNNKELEEYYNHLKTVITADMSQTIFQKYDYLTFNTKKIFFDDKSIDIYSSNDLETLDWKFNKEDDEYVVTLQSQSNDFTDIYTYNDKRDYEYVKIEKNQLSLELRLTKFISYET